MDCSLPGSSVHGSFQARILEWVAISFSRRSSQPRDWTQVSRIAGRRFTVWATREAIYTVAVYISQFIPLPSLTLWYPYLSSLDLCLSFWLTRSSLPFSYYHIYALIYNIRFPLFWLHSDSLWVHPRFCKWQLSIQPLSFLLWEGKINGSQLLWQWKWSHSVMSDSSLPHGLQPTRLLHAWDFPGKSTGVGCHFLLQGHLPDPGFKPRSPALQADVYPLSHQGSNIHSSSVYISIHPTPLPHPLVSIP